LSQQGAFRLWPVKAFAIVGALAAMLAWSKPAPAAEGCPTSGLGSGYLPDCRVYEQVSPVDKNAYEAGSVGAENPGISYASADGSRILYATSGAMGETETGVQPYTLSSRGTSDWAARNAFPRPGDPTGVAYGHTVRSIFPTEDLSSIFFWAGARWLPQVPYNPEFSSDGTSIAGYLLHEGQPLQWVTEPQDEDAFEPGDSEFYKAAFRIRPAGGSPDLSRLYFNYLGTLLPGDEPRVPYANEGQALGVYEYEEGQLRNAGTLPDGTLDPMGAVAAGSVATEISFVDRTSPETFNNQVSADGSTLWFVSPDPTSNSERLTQLYVRVNGTSVLASRSELTGQPAAAGVRSMPHVTDQFPTTNTYVFGAEDGSRAFFQSVDRLTADAPDDATLKAYMYEVASGDLVYVPGLDGGHILEGSHDGSRLLLLNADQTRLELWEEGSGLTLVSETPAGTYSPNTRATADGSVFAFTLSGELPGFPNPSWLPQAYRYEVASGDLDCLSCPPGGPPSSDAVISRAPSASTGDYDGSLVGMRGMSSDGKWVFFDTADALVAADTNGRRDAYRWSEEDGARLLSTGHSAVGSFMLDVSADGTSAFFTTKEGISPQDSDGSYDVYVARVGGGFPSPELASCDGDECQGPGAGAPPLLEPGSKSFRGRGNVGSGPRRLAARLSGRGGKVRLRVSVPAAGRIAVSGPSVRPLKRRLAKPGAYVLHPELKPTARKALTRRGHLKVRVKVRFQPRDGRATARTIATEVTR
jgi:hypothetical protein